MARKKSWGVAVLAAPIFLLLIVTAAAAPPAQKPSGGGLFSAAPAVGVQSVPPDRGLVRSRRVTVNLGQLGGPGGGVAVSGTPEVNDVLLLNLFDDASYTAVLDTIEPQPGGGYAWIGRVQGIEPSQVVFVINQGQTAGNIAVPGGFYEVRYLGNNIHAVVQIDQSAYPGDTPIPVELPENPAPIQPAADDGSQIDVLVAYTAITRQAAGGTTAIENLINLAVTETNQSYANSGIGQRLRLVNTTEVSYAESGNIDTDLSRLTATSDGYMDNLHDLRNSYNADLVALVVENGGAYCGVAYLMTSVSTGFASQAFSVTARDCATGYYSFGHELGHNMGARHDWYVDSGSTPYSYAHGYVNTANRWRTVMAYNNLCSANYGFNCTRLPYWSNPNISYGGDPMGVPYGSSQPADNHRTLNNTAYTVANFRQSSSPPPATGPLVYNSNTIDDNTIGDSSGNNNGIADCGEKIETFVTLKNQGNTTATGVSAVISTGSPYVTFLFNTGSTYPDIPGGGTGANLNDFDFQIDGSTPDGTLLEFNLNITAGNGGPWSASFVVPVTCNPSSGDSYEPDNNSTQAKTITAGTSQTHSIYPVADQDWVKFTLADDAAVTLETSGSPGDDTRLWLYNSSLTQLDYNDDINLYDGNFFSRITRSCKDTALPADTYYAKVDEYGNNDLINAYNLLLTTQNCRDSFEVDDSSGQAKPIASHVAQLHSIYPTGDEDWVTFTLSNPKEVVLRTSGTVGDTRMWLYNSSLVELDFNDDINLANGNLFSAIYRCGENILPAGTYYVKVDRYLGGAVIEQYTLNFSDQCSQVYLPIVVK